MAAEDYSYSLWIYHPNRGAVIFFMSGFLISSCVHFWQCFRYKCFQLTGFFAPSGLLFILGYSLRAYGAFVNPTNLMVYIMSLVFIAVVPPLLALISYHVLGHIMYYVPYLAPVPPGRVLSMFGLLSLLIETLNGVGAAISSQPDASDGTETIGYIFMRASLALQLFLNIAFFLLAIAFHWRCSRAGLARARGVGRPLFTLYASVALLLGRTVFRTVEHLAIERLDRLDLSTAASVVRDEWFFCVFEGSFMLINMLIWNIRHPRRYLPGEINVYLARDGITEVKGPALHDHRSRAWRIFDPMDVRGMCGRRDKYGHRPWKRLAEQEEHAL